MVPCLARSLSSLGQRHLLLTACRPVKPDPVATHGLLKLPEALLTSSPITISEMSRPPCSPNVLVAVDDEASFKSIARCLEHLLNPDAHVVYQLKPANSYFPSLGKAALVVGTQDSMMDLLVETFKSGVDVMTFGVSEKDLEGRLAGCPKCSSRPDDHPFEMDLEVSWSNRTTASTFLLLRSSTPPDSEEALQCLHSVLSRRLPGVCLKEISRQTGEASPPDQLPATLFGNRAMIQNLNQQPGRLICQSKVDLVFERLEGSAETLPDRERTRIHIRSAGPPSLEGEAFDWPKFSSLLKTKSLGRCLIHLAEVGSTFDLLEGPNFLGHGVAILADRQTKGRGRGSNRWISPEGCVNLSWQMEIEIFKGSGRALNLSFVQHLVCLACVHWLRTGPTTPLPVHLKWPNDIYCFRTVEGAFGSIPVKVGGVIVYASMASSTKATLNIGLGINLDNEEPTLSINKVLANIGGSSSKPISREQLVAGTLNTLEEFLDTLVSSSGDGGERIMQLYHEYWLHQDEEVKVLDPDGGEVNGKVVGVDPYGFLMVQLRNGDVHTVHPGDNSFDMMHGLVLPKKA